MRNQIAPWLMLLSAVFFVTFFAGCGEGDNQGGEGGKGGSVGTGGSGATGGDGGTGPGTGGDGGTGGSGGEGGVGGDAGEGGVGGVGGELCGGESCQDGEACQDEEEKRVCRCEKAPDSCPEDQACGEDLRCAPIKAKEFDDCSLVGKVAPSGVVCTQTDTGKRWLRPCEDASDCPGVGMHCRTSVEPDALAVCWHNYCGEGTRIQNGDYFQRCDATVGILDESSHVFGTCVPRDSSDGQRPVGVCYGEGDSTTTCKPKKFQPASGDRCDAGFLCQEWLYPKDSPCNQDSQCMGGQECVDHVCEAKSCKFDVTCGSEAYCSSDLLCAPFGTCVDICNAGTAGPSYGEHASCGGAQVCTASSTLPTTAPVRLGVCGDPAN